MAEITFFIWMIWKGRQERWEKQIPAPVDEPVDILFLGASVYWAGIPVADENFYCRGQFTALHRGHPDQEDLKKAGQFAKRIMGE